MNKIFYIIKKELTDLCRDRRTMFFMFAFPAIIIPILLTGIPKLMKSVASKEINKTLTIAIVGAEYDSQFVEYFNIEEKLELTFTILERDFEESILNDSIDVAMVIPLNAISNQQKHIPVELKLYFRSGKGVDFSKNRIKKLINQYSDLIKDERLIVLNMNEEFFTPFKIEEIDIASDQEKFGKTIGTFLPYFFLIFCFMGAMYPAMDLGAGEKERGTLETILTSPASLFEILFAKFTVISIFGIFSVLFGLLGILLVVKMNSGIPSEIIDVAVSILSINTLLLMLSLLIPIALFFSSFLLSISFYAKTYKEAQSIIAPLQMLIIFPILIGTFPGIILEASTAWIPILNVSLAMNEIIAGTISIPLFLEVFFSLLLFTALSIYIAIQFASREDVIFRG